MYLPLEGGTCHLVLTFRKRANRYPRRTACRRLVFNHLITFRPSNQQAYSARRSNKKSKAGGKLRWPHGPNLIAFGLPPSANIFENGCWKVPQQDTMLDVRGFTWFCKCFLLRVMLVASFFLRLCTLHLQLQPSNNQAIS